MAETGVTRCGQFSSMRQVNGRSFAQELSMSRISMSASLLARNANSRQSLVGNFGFKVN